MKKHISAARKKIILNRYFSGESPKALCEYYSIPKSTLYTWIYKSPRRRIKSKFLAPTTEYKNLAKHSLKLEHEREMLQSYLDYIRATKKQRYEFMDTIYGQYNVHEICDAFKIDRGTYYNHLKAKDKVTKYDERRAFLSEQIRNIYEDSHRTYGAERIRLALKRQGIKVSKEYVLDLMHEIGIVRYNTDSKKLQRLLMWRRRRENLFLKGFQATSINQIWVSDITLFRMNSRDYFICAYMDIYSRKILSYNIGRMASTHLVKIPLIRACSIRKPAKGLILHTDGGAQYDSWSMRREYFKRGILHSFSRPKTPTDNPISESFYSRLKDEFLNTHFFRSETELFDKLEDYVDFYNNVRIHESLNGLSPKEFEQKVVLAKSTK